MERIPTLNNSEWQVMELLWQRPHTLMELVATLEKQIGWSKSTTATMVRRMEEKGIIAHEENGRTKMFRPAISREDAAARETDCLLQRAYSGSVSLLISAMAQRHSLTQEDIDALYAILKRQRKRIRRMTNERDPYHIQRTDPFGIGAAVIFT